MPNTSMVNMARTKAEIKKDKPTKQSVAADKYPWGLEIDLDNDSIKKLGIDAAKYKIGQAVQVVAKAKIERISQCESDQGGINKSITLQITNLQLKSNMSGPSQTASNSNVEKYLKNNDLY